MRISFVCTGNTCRSPIAEFVFRKMLFDADVKNIEVESCGISASDGQAISYLSKILIEENIKEVIVNHKSKMLSKKVLQSVDVFIAMTEGHKTMLKMCFPNDVDKFYSLGELSGLGDVADPYGGEFANYKDAFFLIKSSLEKAYDKIIKILEISDTNK